MTEPSPALIADEVYRAVAKLNQALQMAADSGVQVDIAILDLTKLSNQAPRRYLDAKCLSLLPSNQ